jgi:hypothetical protein
MLCYVCPQVAFAHTCVHISPFDYYYYVNGYRHNFTISLRMHDTGKYIPTILRTCDESNQHAHKAGAFMRTSQAPATSQETFSAKYLHTQKALREEYGNRRAAEKVFCSWDCAEIWNRNHTSIQYRYHTEKLIKIAAGKLK